MVEGVTHHAIGADAALALESWCAAAPGFLRLSVR